MERRHTNFGGNRTWTSRHYRPATEVDVLEILERHKDGRIRAVASGHSWSAIAVCDDVSLDMGRFDQVQFHERNGETFARVGAGCRLQVLLDRLQASGRTLPTLGVIKRQTLGGAISTGTHGSGMPSLSHFVVGVRVAAYDAASGRATIFEHGGGDELRASRCGLGCTGILLSIDVLTVPKHRIEEHVTREPTLEQVLARYRNFPLTQFALVPYAWKYLVFARRTVTAAPGSLAPLYRLYNAVWIDVAFHLLVKASLAAGSRAVKAFLRLTPAVSLELRRTDDSERVLTMRHHYFRHEEMELFVPESRLAQALEVLRYATETFAGEQATPAEALRQSLEAYGLHGELLRNRGSYTQHYPFSIRRLLPEDALVSMGSSTDEALFSISVFTYQKPQAREAYYRYCSWLARCMHSLYGARLHWGKHFPLGADAIARSYPRLQAFMQICDTFDAHGVFRNDFTDRVLTTPSTSAVD